MTKKELLNELSKLGIDASSRQKKEELERVLELAKSANKQVRPHRIYRPQYKEEEVKKTGRKRFDRVSLYAAGAVLALIMTIGIVLFGFNQTFHDNIAYFAEKVGIGAGPEEISGSLNIDKDTTSNPYGPRIFEKNNKTYVVYDYPLIGVDVVYDEGCKRPVCDLNELVQQVKTNISPLLKLNLVDYRSNRGQELIQKHNFAALPVLVFDEHLNKTENFDKVQNFFSLNNGKYILQAEPYKVLSGPDLTNVRFRGALPEKAKIILVEYTSFSCPHCQQAVDIVETVSKQYPDQVTTYVKHFDRGGNDSIAAQSTECAAEQQAFWPMHDKLFSAQEDWIGDDEAGFKKKLDRYARDLDLDNKKLMECVNEGKYAQLVADHTAEAKRLGVENLPTFLLNQDIITGVYPTDQFIGWINETLARMQ